MQFFKPRSWRLRADAAKYRSHREENMADIRAVRAALLHGEEPPAEIMARLQERHDRLVAERGGDRYAKPAPVEPAPVEPAAESAESAEAAKPARGRAKTGA